MKLTYLSAILLLASPLVQANGLDLNLSKAMPAIEKFYLDLHQSPELSYHETNYHIHSDTCVITNLAITITAITDP